VLLILAVVFGVLSFAASRLLAPRRPSVAKEAPYECGIVPSREPPERFPVSFYIVAMLFIMFDIEIIFLFAWAVRFRELGWFGLAAVGIFTLLVIETLGYVWKRGALDWNIPRRARYRLTHDLVDEEAA
ncbi:MAG: NADH-quinone oxidoreductase subunit A, partial [Acidimicrobiia bacterium]|nr:NADH-quinone oxidoreductase subunit A [Acidimicrobiia bacterium]